MLHTPAFIRAVTWRMANKVLGWDDLPERVVMLFLIDSASIQRTGARLCGKPRNPCLSYNYFEFSRWATNCLNRFLQLLLFPTDASTAKFILFKIDANTFSSPDFSLLALMIDRPSKL